MKTSSKPGIRIFSLFALIVSLIGSAVFVTPAHAIDPITTIVINTNTDTTNTCATDGSSAPCSLRDAITYFNAFSGGTITFSANYTITLGSQLPAVTKTITITGTGAGNTIVQAGSPGYRIFEVGGTGNLTLNDLTVQNGSCTAGGCAGGGINNGGSLSINNAMIASNSAAYGGGVYNQSGKSLTVTNSTFTNNTASVFGPEDGAAIMNNGGTVNLTASTVSANNGNSVLGILSNGTGGVMTITNTTVTGNNFGGGGGYVVASIGSALTIVNSTIANNTDTDGYGGISNQSGTLHLKNTIAYGNNSIDCFNFGTLGSIANNLIGVNGTTPANTCGAPVSSSNPILGALANNGGPTQSMALLTGSPAIDAGNAATCSAAPVNNFDQRGVTRPQGAQCDLGAYEFDPTAPSVDTFTVLTPTNNKNLTITAFTGSDNVGVTGYKVTTSSTPPLAGDAGWSAATPLHYMVPGPGSYTLHPWVKDADGNVSPLFATPRNVTVTAPVQRAKNGGFNVYPTPTGMIPTSWVKNAAFSTTDGKDTSIKKEGAASVMIDGAPSKLKTLTQTLAFSGVQGDRLTFSFYVRGSAIPVSAALCQGQVFLYSGATKIMTKTLPCPIGTFAAFQKKTVTFLAPSAFNKVIIKFTYSKSGGTVWFDLASLLK